MVVIIKISLMECDAIWFGDVH